MAITPSSDLKLLKCPIELDNKNQLTFANATAQYNYFNGLTKIEAEGYTYFRQNSVIRYNAHIDSILEYNYVMYRNTNYSNKWFYAYITRMEYVSDSVTNIYIDTDYYQTWMFDLTFKKSFVEREHVSVDTIGLHTVSEGLETGEFVTNSDPVNIFEYSSSGSTAGSNSYVVVCATDFPNSAPSSFNKCINGVFNGSVYLVATGSTATEVATSLDNILSAYASSGKLDYVQSIFMIPKTLVYFNNTTQLSLYSDGTGLVCYYIKSSDSSYKFIGDVTITINSSINGYTPKNKKLFTREFNNIILTNNCGTDVVMAYEDFTNNTPKFTCFGSITPGCSIKCIPLNYRLLADSSSYKSFNYGISGAKFPVCSWTGDTFTNWLTQNGVNMAVGGVMNVAQIIGGAAAVVSGAGAVAGAGMITSGVGGIAGQLAQVHQAHIVPEQTIGNINAGDVTWSSGKAMFTVFPTCIRAERAKIIDDYLTMFGYRVNSLKVPSLNSRTYWNYVKTIDINITANIPQDDLQKIKDMFNTGITLWHDSTKFLDYSQNNTIVV